MIANRAVCTIITKSYLAYARTLAQTLAQYNSQIPLYVLFADETENYFRPDSELFHSIYLRDLSEPEIVEQMCFYYTPFELCCALRGHLHEYMYNRTHYDAWLFLDSDIAIYYSLDEIFTQLQTTSILLSPHSRSPFPPEFVTPHETNFLQCGIYNGGFLGLRKTDLSHQFIQWFKNRLARYSFNDVALGHPRGLFVDQLWLNLVPLLFSDTSYISSPGANVGHWNLFDTSLTKDTAGKLTANEKPLLFVHFSGWDINNPEKISSYSLLDRERENSLWIELAQIYRQQLLDNGYRETSKYPYKFARFHNGDSISFAMRRLYYHHLEQNIAPQGSPFANRDYFDLHFHIPPTDPNNTTLNLLKSELERLAEQKTLIQTQLLQANIKIAAMESSKFWQLRQTWFRLKQKLGFPAD